MLPQVVLGDFAEVDSVELDGAGGGVVETGDEVREGGFAGAAGADEGNAFAGLDGDVDIGEDGGLGFVAEVDVLEFDFAADWWEAAGGVWFGNVVIAVKDVFEAV